MKILNRRLFLGSLSSLSTIAMLACSSGPAPAGTQVPASSGAQPKPAPTVSAAPEKKSPKFTPEFQKVLEAAKAEGEMVWYVGSGRRTAEEEGRFSKAIENSLGVPIKVHFDASTGTVTQQRNKIIDESKAGVKPSIDIFSSGVDSLIQLQDAGVVEPTDWVSYGFLAKSVEPKINGALIWDNMRAMFYNTNLVKGGDIPKSYEDLLDPKWKGKIATNSTPSTFPYIAATVGEQKFLDIMVRLMKEQNLAFLPTITVVPVAVGSGQYHIGISGSIREDREKGAPLAFAPVSKSAPLPQYGSILKNTGRANAARVFMYFVTQVEEGRKLLLEIFGWATRDMPGSDQAQLFGEGRAVDLPFEWYTTDLPRMTKRFADALGLK